MKCIEKVYAITSGGNPQPLVSKEKSFKMSHTKTGWVNTADPAADVRQNPADLPENSFCSAATQIKLYSVDSRH